MWKSDGKSEKKSNNGQLSLNNFLALHYLSFVTLYLLVFTDNNNKHIEKNEIFMTKLFHFSILSMRLKMLSRGAEDKQNN